MMRCDWPGVRDLVCSRICNMYIVQDALVQYEIVAGEVEKGFESMRGLVFCSILDVIEMDVRIVEFY